MNICKKPGCNGDVYVPYEERSGNESIVYFTRELSAEGLIKAYEKVNGNITGKVGVKLHTGEQNGPNIIPRQWVKELMVTATPQRSIARPWRLTDGILLMWTSWMRKAQPCCL